MARYLSLGANAGLDLDFNGFHLVTLNDDHSIAVLDPRRNLATSNLLWLLPQPAASAAWWLDARRARLWLAQPEVGVVRVLDLLAGATTAVLEEVDGPASFAVFPDDERIWVAGERRAVAYRISDAGHAVTLELESGRWQLEADPSTARLLALELATGRLSIADAVTGEVDRAVALDGPRTALFYDPKADAVLVVGGPSDELQRLFLDGAAPETIPLPAAVSSLLASPDGHWIFALDRATGSLVVLDAASLAATHLLHFQGLPAHMTATAEHLYLAEERTGYVSIVHLPSLRADALPAVSRIPMGIPGGPQPLPANGRQGPLTMAALPDGGGLLVAAAADRTLYHSMEGGMQAPSNAFRTWTAPTLVTLVLDRSLRDDGAGGRYRSALRLVAPGRYEVVVHVTSPEAVWCGALEVEGPGADIADALAPPRLDWDETAAVAGRPFELRFRLRRPSDGRTLAPAADVRLLLVAHGRNWHRRVGAEVLPDGSYVAAVEVPRAGTTSALVEAPSLHLAFDRATIRTLEVRGDQRQ